MAHPPDYRVPVYKKVNVRGLDDQIDVVSSSYAFRPWFDGQKPWKVVELPNLSEIIDSPSGWPIFVELEDGTRVGPLSLAILRTAWAEEEGRKEKATAP